MLSHCANPQCSQPFMRLGQGKLFMVETESLTESGNAAPPATSSKFRLRSRRVERYWLCPQCAQILTLAHDHQSGIALVPLVRPVARADAPKFRSRESA
jgi:hypothetical protein